ncbi:MAG: hypothetical protein ACI4NI_04300 [Candidatus Ornithospirochaeta sp.]
MKKRFLIPFVIIVALLLVVSCKKKEESGQSEPVVTVAAEPKTLDKEIPMLVVSEDASTESVENIIEKKEEITEERKPLSFVYRGGTVLLRSNFLSDKGEIKTNISENEAKDFVSRLLSENPDYLDKYSVSFEGESVVLSYPDTTTEEELSTLWDNVRELMDRINAEKEEKQKEVVEAPTEVEEAKPPVVEEKVEEETPELPLFVETPVENESENQTEPEEIEADNAPSPLTNAGKLIDKFSVSLSMSAKYDSGFDSDIKAMFDFSIIPALRIGVISGYEVKGYIPLSLRLRYDIPLVDGLYSFVDGGWRFGLKENKSGVILTLGVGYEYEIFDSFYLFGEVDGQMSFVESIKFMPSLVVGGRYRF